MRLTYGIRMSGSSRCLSMQRKYIIGTIFVAFFLSGCTRTYEVDENVMAIQKKREEIISSFDEDPSGATARYIDFWQKNKEGGDNKEEKVILLTIAGELMRRDKSRYQEYYSYVSSEIDSTDYEVRSSAISALSSAVGRDSIDRLIDIAENDREEISRSALTAIEYRFVTSKYDDSLRLDYEYISNRIESLCDGSRINKQVDEFCKEHR